MRNIITYSFAGVLFLSALIAYFVAIQPTEASVSFGNEYQATSTAASAVYGARTETEGLLQTGFGSLGSVVITGANTGTINLYNATTTNVDLRTGNVATSSILIASFPASTAAGTYVFDAQFTTGLIYSVVGGNVPTTTITWRR